MKEQPPMVFVPKGWGWERWIVNNEKYCGKLLYLAKNRRCSLHYHKLKDETFYLQSGKIKLYFTDDLQKLEKFFKQHVLAQIDEFLDSIILNPGDNFYILPGRVHQMVALRDSELFEFSTQHFEDDSYRIVKGD